MMRPRLREGSAAAGWQSMAAMHCNASLTLSDPRLAKKDLQQRFLNCGRHIAILAKRTKVPDGGAPHSVTASHARSVRARRVSAASGQQGDEQPVVHSSDAGPIV